MQEINPHHHLKKTHHEERFADRANKDLTPLESARKLPVFNRTTRAGEDDAEWRLAAYEQFMRDDSPEDGVYDTY